VVHRRQKYPDFTPKETSQAPEAQTLTPYVDADGQRPDSTLGFYEAEFVKPRSEFSFFFLSG
jgi:hypothetical protein